MSHRSSTLVLSGALVLALSNTGTQVISAQPGPVPQITTTTTTTHNIHTVFVIVMENHNWSNILGNPHAPYINKTLLPVAANARRYYNPPGNHPSLPNYLWMEAGRNFGVTDDDSPVYRSVNTTKHLVTLLYHMGIRWRAYAEDIDGTQCPLADSGLYAVRHNPFVYFDDVTDNLNPNSAYCIAHVRPFTQLLTDISGTAAPSYAFIIPDLCDDMHQSCNGGNAVLQGDTWLSKYVPIIMSSAAFVNGGAIFITWDEGNGTDDLSTSTAEGPDPTDGPLGMIVLSPYAKHGYTNYIQYNHGALLRTVEEIFGIVPPMPADIVRDADLSDLFATFP